MDGLQHVTYALGVGDVSARYTDRKKQGATQTHAHTDNLVISVFFLCGTLCGF